MALLSALRHRNFRLFFAGQAVSQVGDAVFSLAITAHVVSVSTDASALGLVLGVYLGAQVALLLVGGVVVDRLSRRAVLVASDVAQGALAAALAAATWLDLATVPVLAVFGGLFGAAQAVAMPALAAFVPETVPRESIPSANSLYQGTRQVTMLAGPALGGLLVLAGGVGAAYALNAVSFAASAVLLALARGLPRGERPGTHPLRDVLDGARYVMGMPWVWITVLLFALMNVAESGARSIALPFLVLDDMALGAESLGLTYSAAAVGAVAAYVVFGSRPPGSRAGLVAYAAIAVGGLSVLGLAFAPGLGAVLLLGVVRGASAATFILLWETALHQTVAPAMRGRVASLDLLGSFALLPLAMPLAAWTVDAAGTRATFLAAGVVIVALALVGMLVPKAHTFGEGEKAPARTPTG